MRKRQFAGTKKPRLFFDRKLRKTGSTFSLSVGKVLPHSWYLVRLEVIEQDTQKVVLKVTKLLGDEALAQINTANQERKQIA